jgi:hypothetical protein
VGDLLIRDVPDEVVAAIDARAKQRGEDPEVMSQAWQ